MDTAPAVPQNLLLGFLDRMAVPNGIVVIGTSNLNLTQLSERFQSRFQPLRLKAPYTAVLTAFLNRWKLRSNVAKTLAVGCGGNVRAAVLDLSPCSTWIPWIWTRRFCGQQTSPRTW